MIANGTIDISHVQALLQSRLSVFPAVRKDKYPTGLSWGEFQKRRMLPAEVAKHFAQADAICVICGPVSDGVEVLDFDDGGSCFDAWAAKIRAADQALFDSLPIERSPSGGYHVYTRTAAVAGNTKLAKRIVHADGPDDVTISGKTFRPKQQRDNRWYVELVLIETRGRGGLIVCDPTPGYTITQGDLTSIPEITDAQRALLLDTARSFDEKPKPVDDQTAGGFDDGAGTGSGGTTTPWGDYNERGDFRAVLHRNGWRKERDALPGDDNEHWRRPGKSTGTSATVNGDRLFYCWSSNGHPFEEGTAYNPFQVFMRLEHEGDARAAARALANLGYGTDHRGNGKVAHQDKKESPAKPAEPPPWPELDLLDDDHLPEFPIASLPERLADWIWAEAHEKQVPADLPGLLALASVAAAIATHVEVEPARGWREGCNIFVAPLLPPGSRKSAVFADATRPLRDAEAELQERARPTVARELSERRLAQKRLDKLEKQAVDKGDDAAAKQAGDLAEKLACWPEPSLPQILVDDCTPERLAVLLANNGGRLASMSAEGGPFDAMGGKYSKHSGPDFIVFLQGHAGDQLRTDRMSRAAVRCERPALTCAFAVQPQVVAGLAGDPVFRGRGLLGRFLFARPADLFGKRKINAEPMPEAVASAYADLVRDLAVNPPHGVLTLLPAAASLFNDWQVEVEQMLAEGGELEGIRDWGGKLCGATARLAGILHVAKHHPQSIPAGIDVETIGAAIELGRYLLPHAQVVLGDVAGGLLDDARYVLRWITRHDRHEFTKSEVQHHGKRRFPIADDINPALGELAQRGYIRKVSVAPSGPGRPSEPYEVNPAVFDIGNIGSAFRDIGNTGPTSLKYQIQPPSPPILITNQAETNDSEYLENRSQYSQKPTGQAGRDYLTESGEWKWGDSDVAKIT